MLRNIGGTEKGIRLVLGGLFVVAVLIFDLPPWGTALLSVVGIIAVLTGAVGYCPAWTVFGISTCPVKSTSQ